MSELQRGTLPIADVDPSGVTTYDARDPDTSFPPIEPLRPPAGAPNVLVVLLDDVGFGASSAFGGPGAHADGGAAGRRRPASTRASTPRRCARRRGPRCCPGATTTRSGWAASPRSRRRRRATTRCGRTRARRWRRSCRLNGYATAQFGKCHEVPVWESSPAGPFDHWPTPAAGSSTSTGSSAARRTSGTRRCTRATRRSSRGARPRRATTSWPTWPTEAIAWMRQQKALTPDKPFFIYFAPGATHTPHHVPRSGPTSTRAGSTSGWDALREETFARQKELGVIPPDAELTERHDEIPAWDDIRRALQAGPGPPDGGLRRLPGVRRPPRRPAHRRARRARHPRRHARLLHHRRQRRLGRGHHRGHVQRDAPSRTAAPTSRPPSIVLEHIDELGTPTSYNHYAIGWAHAHVHAVPVDQAGRLALGRHPQRHDRALAGRIAGRGELRHQFSHVIDVAPTDPRARRAPGADHGARRHPEADARHRAWPTPSTTRPPPERHETQYFEMLCNRGIYHKGWTRGDQAPHARGTSATSRSPSTTTSGSSTTAPTDWTQAHDLAAEHPDKLAELQRLFLIEAARYNVLPLDDRQAERIQPEIAGRPDARPGRRRRCSIRACAA